MTDFEKIAASAPVDRTAARQLARGVHFTPQVALADYFEECPPLSDLSQAATSPVFFDFSGMEFGRLKVIGRIAKKNKKAPAAWACRCRCGHFCSRTNKSLKAVMAGEHNPENSMCGACQYTQKIRAGFRFTDK